MSEQTKEEREAEIVRNASPADRDTEIRLAELHELVVARRKDPERETRYERERDALAADLLEHGPRYFIDENGDKRYAYAVQPEPVEVDMDELMAMYEDGELSTEVMDQIAPRRVDKEGLRRVVSRKKITPAQFTRFAKLRKGTAFVQFSDPIY